MSKKHAMQDNLLERIHGFIVAGERNELADDGWSDFEQLLRENDEACRLYAEYMDVSIFLPSILDMVPNEESSSVGIIMPEPLPAAPLWTPEFFGNATTSAMSSFSSSWAVAYLIAAVIFGVGLVIGALVHVSGPADVVRHFAPSKDSNPQSPIPSPLPKASVARVTGMTDCQWADPTTETIPGAFVPLGRKYALSAGLMEITYDTGAKVILQGPVTYEVESSTGGYLSVGKLTAKLGKRSAVSSQRSESANQKSEISNHKSPDLCPLTSDLFAIRTPSAIVTDIGTEFGVEVNKQGLTQVHVLQGMVDARIVGSGGETGPHERLIAGQAVEIGGKGSPLASIPFAPRSFTRKLREPSTETPAEAAYIHAVLADKPMGYWPLNESAGARRFADRSGHGIHGYAMHKVLAGRPGPLSSDSRAIELDGNGYIDLGYHPEFAMKNDFTVEAWTWIGNAKRHSMVLSAHGEGDHPIGWGLAAGSGDGNAEPGNRVSLHLSVYRAANLYLLNPAGEAIEARWLHVAVVLDRTNTAHFYINGKHCGATKGGPVCVDRVWLAIGAAEMIGTKDSIDANLWRGRLAHVAVYPTALTSRQLQSHYDQGNAVPETKTTVIQKVNP